MVSFDIAYCIWNGAILRRQMDLTHQIYIAQMKCLSVYTVQVYLGHWVIRPFNTSFRLWRVNYYGTCIISAVFVTHKYCYNSLAGVWLHSLILSACLCVLVGAGKGGYHVLGLRGVIIVILSCWMRNLWYLLNPKCIWFRYRFIVYFCIKTAWFCIRTRIN